MTLFSQLRWRSRVAPGPAPATRLTSMFHDCRYENRAALIGYLPAGYPTVARCRTLLCSMLDAGCDLVEIGLPWPSMMDGPVVKAATQEALRHGIRWRDVWALIETVSASGGRAMLMGCWEPIQRYGPKAFARDLAHAGGLGAITPDLLPGTHLARAWCDATDGHDLGHVFFVSPDDSEAAVAAAATASSGWLYAATQCRTGGAAPSQRHARSLVRQVRTHVTDLPVGLGFGVRSAEHAAAMAREAEAVIAGSVLVETAQRGPAAVEYQVADLAWGVREGRSTATDS